MILRTLLLPFHFSSRSNSQRPLLTFLLLLLLYSSVDSGGDNSAKNVGSFRKSIKTGRGSNSGRLNSIEIGRPHVDIVGYGEDCSSEGPFCDEAHHLICDREVEICVCDKIGGYVHYEELQDGSGFRIYSESKQECVRQVPVKQEARNSEVKNQKFARAESFKQGKKPLKKKVIEKVVEVEHDVDIVGFGEDCSGEGPFCDEAQHLICDPEDETCICDAKGGFVHYDAIKDGSGYRIYLESKRVCLRPGEWETETVKLQINAPESDTAKQKKPVKVIVEDEANPDIVGFGEDCSTEGPFCDKAQNLVCDPEEETCVCDLLNGYLHIDDVPGGREDHWEVGLDDKQVCVSQKKITERTEKLLGIGGQESLQSLAKKAKDLDMYLDLDEYLDEENEEIPARPPAREDKLSKIYNDFMASLNSGGKEAGSGVENRLEPFKLDRNFDYSGYSDIDDEVMIMKDLTVKEIMKYGKGVWDLQDMESLLREFVEFYFEWMDNRLAKQICGTIFDIDQDGVITHQEYVIVILSEIVRKQMMPKVFNDLITPLLEETCIRIDDLRQLDHDPAILEVDFQTLDVNQDGCFSFPEFVAAMDGICKVNWLDEVMKSAGITSFFKDLDPSPEEMFVRRMIQHERLSTNWRVVDKDGDGFVSRDELQSDLVTLSHAVEDNYEETDSMLAIMDHNQDGKISLTEAAYTISTPLLTEEYQFEWLESLYELFETDEEEVQEYLEAFLKDDAFSKYSTKDRDENEPGLKDLRVFTIFDKNRNGEMDEVEFKMLLEILRKYVVHGLLNETLASIDNNGDHRITVFEYQAFFKNASSKFQAYLKNLLTVILENNETLGNEAMEDDDDSDYEEDDEDEHDQAVSSARLSKRAAKMNETLIIHGLFMRLDTNSDGFLTQDDLYSLVTSYHMRMSDYELQKEFDSLDKDQDGVLTEKDSEDFLVPVDFEIYKEHAYLSEEVFPTDFENQFQLMDSNANGIIQMNEWIANKAFLFSNEEEEFLSWIESYLKYTAPQMEPGGEKTFKEFDENCDGLISKAEFLNKLNRMLQSTAEDPQATSSLRTYLSGDFADYFNRLDLNKDGKVSYNEFNFLLLRNNKRINEK